MKYTLGEFTTDVFFYEGSSTIFENITAPWILITDKEILKAYRSHKPSFIPTENEEIPIIEKGSELERKSAHTAGIQAILALPAGEASKNMEGLEFILRAAFTLGLGRDAIFFALGGGAVSDVAGFAASVYMRGVRFVIAPTTVLSMVDACFGGKTGINYYAHKNMIGSMYPAGEIRISTQFLRTLPEQEYRNGLAEVIKSAMLGDAELLSMLEDEYESIMDRNEEALLSIIQRSLKVKAEIVASDFRESELRSHLNLGHTFAHALESVGMFSAWGHGKAVAWGLLRALRLGEGLGITEPAYRQRIQELLGRYGYELNTREASVASIYSAMHKDKKRKSERIRFVLQKRQGETLLQEADENDVLAVLAEVF